MGRMANLVRHVCLHKALKSCDNTPIQGVSVSSGLWSARADHMAGGTGNAYLQDKSRRR